MLYVNEHVHDHLWDRPVPPEWIRSFGNGDFPVLTAADGQTVVISGHPAERGTFERYVAAAARTDLLDDPRFVDVPARVANLAGLVDELRRWAASMADPASIESALAEQGLATGVLRTVREVCATDWAAARDVVVEIDDRGGGVLRVPNAPWRFEGSDVGLRGHPSYRGEDNRAVLTDVLGLGASEIDELEAGGVLSSRVPSAR